MITIVENMVNWLILLFENGKESYIPKTHLQYSAEVLHDNIDSLNDNGIIQI
jgi:hypothetical protein